MHFVMETSRSWSGANIIAYVLFCIVRLLVPHTSSKTMVGLHSEEKIEFNTWITSKMMVGKCKLHWLIQSAIYCSSATLYKIILSTREIGHYHNQVLHILQCTSDVGQLVAIFRLLVTITPNAIWEEGAQDLKSNWKILGSYQRKMCLRSVEALLDEIVFFDQRKKQFKE